MSLFLLLLAANIAGAKERIINFDAQIYIKPDRSIKVVETIEVWSEERKIKRGIFREIPQYYYRKDGSQRLMPVRVESVLKDGEKASWFVGDSDENIRIYIGKRFVNVSSGVHKYQITYHIANFIFDEKEEAVFYWNVSGHYWQFSIENLSAKIYFPADFDKNSITKVQQITGVVKGSNQNKSQLNEIKDNYIEFKTTSPLLRREGLTLKLNFNPSLLVPSPERAEVFAAMDFVESDRYSSSAIAVALFLLVLMISWHLYGVDFKDPIVIPRFEAPEKVSPALARYIYSDDCDTISLTANLMKLAASSHIKIEHSNQNYSVLRGEKYNETNRLQPDERVLIETMLRSKDHFLFTQARHQKVSDLIDSFSQKVESLRSSRFNVELNPLNTVIWFLNMGLLYFLFDNFIFSVFGSLAIFVTANFCADMLVGLTLPRLVKHLKEPESFGNVLFSSFLFAFFISIFGFMISFSIFHSQDFVQVFSVATTWAQQDFVYSFSLLFILAVGKKIWNPLSSRRSVANHKMLFLSSRS